MAYPKSYEAFCLSIEDQIIANSTNPTKESLLGRGGRGIVYKCWRRYSGQDVAVKEVPIERASLDEGRIMKDLSGNSENWPYFVRLYNEFANFTARYLVMEYCSFGTLEKYVKQNGGKIPSKKRRFHFAHLAEGVKKLHSLGYVHRDLKPSNILVTQRSDGKIRMKISDFGLATAYDEAYYLSPINLPSSPYRAPEIIEGLEYDNSADVYSLGAIYFFMKRGRDPKFRFDSCGYPKFASQTLNVRHYKTENRMMCQRTDERLELEDLEYDYDDGYFYVPQPQRYCAVCGRELCLSRY